MKKEDHRDAEFLRRVRAALDESADRMDAETLSRLRRARYAALEAGVKKRGGLWTRFRIPAVGLATACIALFAVFLYFRAPEKPDVSRMEDVEILASGDNLDLFAQLDFYTWVAEEEAHAG